MAAHQSQGACQVASPQPQVAHIRTRNHISGHVCKRSPQSSRISFVGKSYRTKHSQAKDVNISTPARVPHISTSRSPWPPAPPRPSARSSCSPHAPVASPERPWSLRAWHPSLPSRSSRGLSRLWLCESGEGDVLVSL